MCWNFYNLGLNLSKWKNFLFIKLTKMQKNMSVSNF